MKLDSNLTMDDLTQARAALVALEKREHELLDELRSIQDAVRLQRSIVEGLIAQMPMAPVHRLPTESLLRVFEFYLDAAPETCDTYRHSKRDLASVSRHWRDVILCSPSLWTKIMVSSHWTEARAKTYVTRSSQSLLDIDFLHWSDRNSDGIFTTILNTLASSAHRWHSLTIQEDVPHFHRSLVLEKLNHLLLPSLKQVSIGNFPGSLTEQGEIYLRPERSPHLGHVHLHVVAGTLVNFHIPSGISALSLEFYEHEHIRHQSVFNSLSGQGLTSLHVSGNSIDFDLPPNSIQLPLLKEFVCSLGHAKALIRALVAPSLKCFHYSPSLWRDSPSVIFSDLSSKFNNVDYLCLSRFTTENLSETVCLAFPNVCHLTLVPAIRFEPYLRTAEFPSGVLHWKNLKRLTIENLRDYDLGCLSGLVDWLQQRVFAGQSKLQVELSCYECGSSSLFQRLLELCYLEKLDVRHKADVVVCCSGSRTWVEVQPYYNIGELSTTFAIVRRTAVTQSCECAFDV